jgi:hypothetical protein
MNRQASPDHLSEMFSSYLVSSRDLEVWRLRSWDLSLVGQVKGEEAD